MRTLITSCLVVVASAVLAGLARAEGDSVPATIVLRAGPKTKYAEVVKILKALQEAQVSGIQVESAGQQTAGMSAVIRTRSDTPYKTVVRALEAMRSAGVRETMLIPEP